MFSAKSRFACSSFEARTMLDAVERAGVIHMIAFNYRRTPAVTLASATLTGNLLLPNFRDGCKITRIVEAIVKSAKSREWQEVSG